jgi:two-component system response regulator PilR (NtrC family)
MVASNEFREDLYYRINVIELHVPALRERGDDILLLADHILHRLNGWVSLGEDARSALLAYNFPGNVRELENMLERAVTLCLGGIITAKDLNMRDPSEPGTATAPPGKLGEQVDDVQRQAIVDALEKTRYNKTAAAKLLGLSFRQLRYRIKKLGIE